MEIMGIRTIKEECNGRMYEPAIGADIYGPECDIHSSPDGKGCLKNPGHQGFIPIKEFTEKHLPEGCPKRKEYYKFLQSYAERVVHLCIDNVSTERPRGFPFYKHRGRSIRRRGSGFVTAADLCGEGGTGVPVVADLIEDCLRHHTLAKLDAKSLRHLEYGNQHTFNLDDNQMELCIDHWIKEHLLDSTSDKVRDDFTRNLIQEIRAAKETGSASTLNDYRKRKEISVSEFWLSLLRSVNQLDTERVFFEDFLPLIDKPCQCCECRRSGVPKKTWWLVTVRTAAHLVFDHQEVLGTKASLYHDDVSSDGFDSNSIIMHGIFANKIFPERSVKIKKDSNNFMCALHDYEIGKRMEKLAKDLRVTFLEFGRKGRPFPTAVIGHPHGSSKYISFGEECLGVERPLAFVDYTASTCPGNSGGPVIGGKYGNQLGPVLPHSEAMESHRNRSGQHQNFFSTYKWGRLDK